MRQFHFSPALPETPDFTIGDAIIFFAVASILYAGARLAFHVPTVIAGPDISLSPSALPWYAALSVGRMVVAYLLSLLFSLFYGYAAARNRTARTVLMPLLDVLQSVPILSFGGATLLYGIIATRVLMETARTINDDNHLLKLQNVSKAYRLETKQFLALKDVNLQISPGEFVCLLGPSGCGKSTLLRIIAGLNVPSFGMVAYHGQPLRGVNPHTTIVFKLSRFIRG
jgi:ABC-type multidrug transport system fused ATPase/permease subunit